MKIKETQLFQLTLVHFREFFREPGILFWAVLFPVLTAWVLGIAFSGKNELTQTIVVEKGIKSKNIQFDNFIKSNSPKLINDSTIIIAKDYGTLGKVSYRFIESNLKTAEILLKKGNTQMIISADRDSLFYHFDPLNQDAKLLYIFLSSTISNKPINFDNHVLKPFTTVGSRYIDFLIPGLIALGIMNSLVWGISYGLIEMRVKKLLRRMIATAMNRSVFMVSYFLARITLSIFEASVLFFFSKYYFDFSLQGSFLALIIVFIAGNIAFGGLSVLMSSRAGNTRTGNGLINFVTLPMTFLSGIFFSYHNFPELAEKIIAYLPLTLLADGLRSVFIEGAMVPDILKPAVILISFGLVCFTIGIRVFKWY